MLSYGGVLSTHLVSGRQGLICHFIRRQELANATWRRPILHDLRRRCYALGLLHAVHDRERCPHGNRLRSDHDL